MLAVVHSGAMNIRVHVSFSIMIFSGYMPSSGIVGVVHFPDGLGGKQSACSSGDPGLIPGLGKSPGERTSYPLQCSSLNNYNEQWSLAGYSPWDRRVRHK